MVIAVLIAAIVAQPQTQADETNSRCGSYCLYVALKSLDFPIGEFAELEARLGPPGGGGYSLAQLDEAAKTYGAQTLGVTTSAERLRRRTGRFCCIAHVEGNHFVLLTDVKDAQATLVDPPKESTVPLDTLGAVWGGTALLISPAPLAAEESLGSGGLGVARMGWIAGGVGVAFLALWLFSRRVRSGGARAALLALALSAAGGCAKSTETAVAGSPACVVVGSRERDLGEVESGPEK